jgi:hypothetical protein
MILKGLTDQGKKVEGGGRKNILRVPPLCNRYFLPLNIQLSFSWLRTLHKGTLLRMELAQHTTRLTLIDHTPTLPPPTRITRAILPASSVGSRLCRCGTAHACRKLRSYTGVGWFDRGFEVTGLARSYSNGLGAGHAARARGRHGVVRLDWSVDLPRYRNSVSYR